MASRNELCAPPRPALSLAFPIFSFYFSTNDMLWSLGPQFILLLTLTLTLQCIGWYKIKMTNFILVWSVLY